MGAKTQGRRRPDTREGDLPANILPGDYWKIVKDVGAYWHVAVPLGRGDEAYALGNLINHTVREHLDDNTISVRPGDGSSNSILVSRGGAKWHGYIEHGVLEEC